MVRLEYRQISVDNQALLLELDYAEHSAVMDLIYDVTPVGPHEIRILTLDPADTWEAAIRCHLDCIDLQRPSNLDFEAVSYSWDGALLSKTILVDDKTYFVTTSLESFLRHRREENVRVTLWVDAVCINQADPNEKGRQIPLMSAVYSAASCLTIWLGSASHNSDIAIRTLRHLGLGSPYAKMPILTGNTLTAIESLLSRSWWSRIWILQELKFGGMGHKLDKIRVKCGLDEIMWMNLVIATARMQAHKDDMRQFFPNIKNILTLEELRKQAEDECCKNGSEGGMLDAVSTYRRFQSSDPRDKIYALLGITFRHDYTLPTEIQPDYLASTSQVYTSFARYALCGGSELDILRHCRTRSIENLPSWVPDWSVASAETPLPRFTPSICTEAPWWSNPPSPGSKESPKVEHKSGISFMYRGGSMERLKATYRELVDLELADSGIYKFEISIPTSTGANSGESTIFLIQDASANSDIHHPDVYNDEALKPQVIRQTERITKQRTMERLVHASMHTAVPYQAGGRTNPIAYINLSDKTLGLQVVLWDSIDIIHDSFVDEVEAEWEHATNFMVSVGRCKQCVLQGNTENGPYQSRKKVIEAFWLTLFAGRTTGLGAHGAICDIRHRLKFENWLPEIPRSWIPGRSPVTVTNTGRIFSADVSLMGYHCLRKQLEARELGSKELEFEMKGIAMQENLQPDEWSDEDCRIYASKFDQLASSWHQQPFDLYHRPFNLPCVVADPYWETRRYEDKLALSQSRKCIPKVFIGVQDPKIDYHQFRKELDDSLARTVRIVPSDTLEPGFEKYALGRRFFITKRGYFGLAPKGAESGDRIVVVFGSEVPFIMRKHSSGGGYELLGETYVHGIMGGEVIKEWQNGETETGKIFVR